jgi:hypothetical protein
MGAVQKSQTTSEYNAINEVDLISLHAQFYKDLVNRSQQVLGR